MELRLECNPPEDYDLGPIYEVEGWDVPLSTEDAELVIVEDVGELWLDQRVTIAGDPIDTNIDYSGRIILTQTKNNWKISFMAHVEHGYVRSLKEYRKVQL
jgi:hypothetical protein